MPKITIKLSEQAEQILRRHTWKKGDLSRIVEQLILEHLKEDWGSLGRQNIELLRNPETKRLERMAKFHTTTSLKKNKKRN
jgi:hypothetical protein